MDNIKCNIILIYLIFIITISTYNIPTIAIDIENQHYFNPAMTSARVIASSQSGQSIIIDQGRFNGRKRGDLYYIFIKGRDLKNNKTYHNLKAIGIAEVVKVMQSKSFLYFEKATLNLQNKRIFFEPSPLIGRKPIKVSKKKVFSDSDNFKMPAKIVKLSNGYNKEDLKFENDENLSSNSDAKITSYGEYKKFPHKSLVGTKSVDIYRPKNIMQTIATLSVKDRIKRSIIKAESQGILDRDKIRKYALEGIYNQPNNNLENRNSSYGRLLSKHNKIIKEGLLDKKFEEFFKKNNKDFSLSLSDKELHKLFVRSGLKAEINRQLRALTYDEIGSEVNIVYQQGLSDNTTALDSSYRSKSSSFELSYEYYLINLRRRLENFSLDLNFVNASNNINLNLNNGNFNSNLFGFNLNYYLLSPRRLDKFLPYISLGIKFGTSVISSAKLSSNYSYNANSIPAAKIGLKYRFQNTSTSREIYYLRMGLNIFIEYNQMNYASKSSINIADNINASYNINETKIGFGFSVYL